MGSSLSGAWKHFGMLLGSGIMQDFAMPGRDFPQSSRVLGAFELLQLAGARVASVTTGGNICEGARFAERTTSS